MKYSCSTLLMGILLHSTLLGLCTAKPRNNINTNDYLKCWRLPNVGVRVKIICQLGDLPLWEQLMEPQMLIMYRDFMQTGTPPTTTTMTFPTYSLHPWDPRTSKAPKNSIVENLKSEDNLTTTSSTTAASPTRSFSNITVASNPTVNRTTIGSISNSTDGSFSNYLFITNATKHLSKLEQSSNKSSLERTFIANRLKCCCEEITIIQKAKDYIMQTGLFADDRFNVVNPKKITNIECREGVCGRTATLITRCDQIYGTINVTTVESGTSSRMHHEVRLQEGCRCLVETLPDNNLVTSLGLSSNDEPGRNDSSIFNPTFESLKVLIKRNTTASAVVSNITNDNSSNPSTNNYKLNGNGEILSKIESGTSNLQSSSIAASLTTIQGNLHSIISEFNATIQANPIGKPKVVLSETPDLFTSAIAVKDKRISIEDTKPVTVADKLDRVANKIIASVWSLLSVFTTMFSEMASKFKVDNVTGLATTLNETAKVINMAAEELLSINENIFGINSSSDVSKSLNLSRYQNLAGLIPPGCASTVTTTVHAYSCSGTAVNFSTKLITDSSSSVVFLGGQSCFGSTVLPPSENRKLDSSLPASETSSVSKDSVIDGLGYSTGLSSIISTDSKTLVTPVASTKETGSAGKTTRSQLSQDSIAVQSTQSSRGYTKTIFIVEIVEGNQTISKTVSQSPSQLPTETYIDTSTTVATGFFTDSSKLPESPTLQPSFAPFPETSYTQDPSAYLVATLVSESIGESLSTDHSKESTPSLKSTEFFTAVTSFANTTGGYPNLNESDSNFDKDTSSAPIYSLAKVTSKPTSEVSHDTTIPARSQKSDPSFELVKGNSTADAIVALQSSLDMWCSENVSSSNAESSNLVDFSSRPLKEQLLLIPAWREYAIRRILDDFESSRLSACQLELNHSLPLSGIPGSIIGAMKGLPDMSGLTLAVMEFSYCMNKRNGCSALVGDNLGRRLASAQHVGSIFSKHGICAGLKRKYGQNLLTLMSLIYESEGAVDWARNDSCSNDAISADSLAVLLEYQQTFKPLAGSLVEICSLQSMLDHSETKISQTQSVVTNVSVTIESSESVATVSKTELSGSFTSDLRTLLPTTPMSPIRSTKHVVVFPDVTTTTTTAVNSITKTDLSLESPRVNSTISSTSGSKTTTATTQSSVASLGLNRIHSRILRMPHAELLSRLFRGIEAGDLN